jgi:hypothetical protein
MVTDMGLARGHAIGKNEVVAIPSRSFPTSLWHLKHGARSGSTFRDSYSEQSIRKAGWFNLAGGPY